MSTMKVDSIVSSGGTNTAQINGITPALASQAEAEAGTDNTKLMTPLRVAQAITALANPTTSQVLDATAGLTLGAVGSYAFLTTSTNNTTITAGTTIAGSSLFYASATITASTAGLSNGARTATAPSGTWRALGGGQTVASGTATAYVATIFVRIS